jgi:UDP-glucose 4-epimerase
MKTIIVTGGCGYIGSQTIIEILKATPYHVISIDNLSNSSEKTLDRIKAITGKTIINYKIDLCNLKELRKLFENHNEISGVIHFAALKSVNDSVQDPLGYYTNNIESLLNIIQCSKEHKISNFIFSSSCSVYGNVAILPVKEDSPLSIPLSPYAHTKLIGEEMIKFIAKQSDISFVLLRYFNPVGGDLSGLNGEDPINLPSSLVPVITQTAAGLRDKMYVYGNSYNTRDGSCIRDYVHVIDIANAHIAALNYLIEGKNTSHCDFFNIGSGNGTTVLEAIKSFEKITNLKINFEIAKKREGDIEAIYSDSSKARVSLGWIPKYDIDVMMESAWKWQQNCLIKNKQH